MHHARVGQVDRQRPTLARPSVQPAASVKHAALRTAFGRAPWELSADEFAAVAEPFLQLQPSLARPDWPKHRLFGLTVSTMRFGMRLRLVAAGGPEDGYLADVDWDDEASLEDPRRAFVVDALARGEGVPAQVLADYPDLQIQR